MPVCRSVRFVPLGLSIAQTSLSLKGLAGFLRRAFEPEISLWTALQAPNGSLYIQAYQPPHNSDSYGDGKITQSPEKPDQFSGILHFPHFQTFEPSV